QSTLRRFRWTAVLGSAGAAILAVGGLLGYIPGLRALGSIRPGYVPMAPSTAVCFLIISAALFGHTRERRTGSGRAAVIALILLVAVFGLLDLIGSIAGLDLTFEDRLTSNAGTLGGIPLARMSPATSPGFVMAGLGTLLLWLRPSAGGQAARFGHSASSLGVLTALLGAIVALAYTFGTPLMYWGGTVPMAATTAMAFLFVGAALSAAAGPRSFPMRLVAGDSLSARLSAVFLPLVASALLVQ